MASFFSSEGLGGLFADPLNIFGTRAGPGDELLEELSKAEFGSDLIQNFLPKSLQQANTGFLGEGIRGIGDLIKNPGGLSPTVADAIRPRLAAESERISQNFRGIQQNQAGAAARGNVPVSIQAALSSALDVAQSRSQRGARREALSESEGLRRQDLQKTLEVLNLINSFIEGRLAPSVGGASQLAANSANRQAAGVGAAGGVLSFFSASEFKEDFRTVSEDEILNAIKRLPVYEWSYKGEKTRHVGPMAEDFLSTFALGEDPKKIPIVDAIGTLMAATQALASKVERLEATG